jgi:hypothetical protein
MMDYKELSNNLLEQLIDVYGIDYTIQFLLNIKYSIKDLVDLDFYYKDVIYEMQSIIVDKLDRLLNYLDSNNEIYEIWIGYYNNDNFELDKLLNGDSINAMMDIKGATLFDYLLSYNNNKSAIKIRVDNESMDTYYIEYDGYDLDFDLG